MGVIFGSAALNEKFCRNLSQFIFQEYFCLEIFSRNFASEKVSRNFNLKLLIIKRDKLIHIFIHITYTYINI